MKISKDSENIIYYKSEDGLSDLEMMAYFWNERGDIERYTGTEKVYKRLPELKKAYDGMKQKQTEAEKEFVIYLQELIDNHNPSEWGN